MLWNGHLKDNKKARMNLAFCVINSGEYGYGKATLSVSGSTERTTVIAIRSTVTLNGHRDIKERIAAMRLATAIIRTTVTIITSSC